VFATFPLTHVTMGAQIIMFGWAVTIALVLSATRLEWHTHYEKATTVSAPRRSRTIRSDVRCVSGPAECES
jgi:cytochrome bd-type quinol oxidase subunit 2